MTLMTNPDWSLGLVGPTLLRPTLHVACGPLTLVLFASLIRV